MTHAMIRSLRPRCSPIWLAMAAACLVACGPADSPSARSADDSEVAAPPVPSAGESLAGVSAAPTRLTADGWGPLRIGMTRAEVVAAAGEDANPGAVGGPEPEACDEFRPAEAPEGMRVMIERDRLTRITLSRVGAVVTERGFTVGDSASAIRAAYGAEAVVTPHKYEAAPAEYITVWKTAPDVGEARGIVYEIGGDGTVAHIHAGGASVQYVEGCL